jgi:predicted nucleic acid-binding Zn ribbon protein
MRIELNCAKCGENRFTIIQGMKDEADVSCSECGHKIGTMGDLKQLLAAEVMKRAAARPASDQG